MTHYASQPSLILGSNFQERFKYNFILRDRTFLFECKNQLFPSSLFRPSSGYQLEKVFNDVTVSIAKLNAHGCQHVACRGEFYVTEQEEEMVLSSGA